MCFLKILMEWLNSDQRVDYALLWYGRSFLCTCFKHLGICVQFCIYDANCHLKFSDLSIQSLSVRFLKVYFYSSNKILVKSNQDIFFQSIINCSEFKGLFLFFEQDISKIKSNFFLQNFAFKWLLQHNHLTMIIC